MAIALDCRCGKRLVVGDSDAGKRFQCEACGNPLTVPGRDGPSAKDPEGVALDALLSMERQSATVDVPRAVSLGPNPETLRCPECDKALSELGGSCIHCGWRPDRDVPRDLGKQRMKRARAAAKEISKTFLSIVAAFSVLAIGLLAWLANARTSQPPVADALAEKVQTAWITARANLDDDLKEDYLVPKRVSCQAIESPDQFEATTATIQIDSRFYSLTRQQEVGRRNMTVTVRDRNRAPMSDMYRLSIDFERHSRHDSSRPVEFGTVVVEPFTCHVRTGVLGYKLFIDHELIAVIVRVVADINHAN